MEYAFNVYNKLAADGVSMAVDALLSDPESKGKKGSPAGACSPDGQEVGKTPLEGRTEPEDLPVILCIGSDLAIGDSLGPIVGSMLKYKTQGLNVFIYGTLSAPVTAKEIGYMRTFLRETHRGKKVVAIDAAVGNEGDVGLIKITDSPLYPGAGANKRLGSIGNLSLMGIVAEKSLMNYGLLNTTRLNLVYSMSEIVSDGLSSLLWERHSRARKRRIV